MATLEQIKTVIGLKPGERKEPVKKTKRSKEVDYPSNLLKELGLGITHLSDDKKALVQLQDPIKAEWIKQGFNKRITALNESVELLKEELIHDGKLEQAQKIWESPSILSGISNAQAGMFLRGGFQSIGSVCVLMQEPEWYSKVPEIGAIVAPKLEGVMRREGFLK